VVLGGWLVWYVQPQPLLPEATAALTSTPEVSVSVADDGRLTFTPTSGPPAVGLILYPGGKVPPAAYAPAARDIAAAGYLVVIAPMPLNLAVFGIDAAEAVMADHPEIGTWAIGGHSLGGSMAAQYIDTHPGVIDALVLWASYSAADLSDDGLQVTSSFGSLDNGRESFISPVNVARLGQDPTLDEIDGGNHEQMGWYTGQPNDPPARIPRVDQQARIVAATTDLLDQLAR
jgi:pimeloyl-ACP methyl ester carboxylesterase